MHVDEFLNARSISNLQTLQWFWAPTSRRSSSKFELLRLLRQEMLSPERVRACYQDLEEPQREFLRGLLRHEGYAAEVTLVLRRLPTPPPTPQAQRQLLDELARHGFLHYQPAKSWNQYESFHAQVPEELGDVLAEVLNLDTREPALMLSLSRFLSHLPPEDAERLAGAALPLEEAIARLIDPAAVESRLAALPDEAVQRAVRIALSTHAGILPLERFPSLGLDIESVDGYAWRTALESQLLGTFGHLSLLEFGIGDDHDCLVVYQEIVQAHAAAQGRADQPIDHVYACGIDFLTDLGVLCDLVRAEPTKLTSAGRFFKGARNQLAARSALRTSFFMDEDTLLFFRLTVARELRLLDLRPDGRLHATRASLDWQALPLAAQARSVLAVLLGFGEANASRPLFADLAAVARRVVAELPPGTWCPTTALFANLVSRYLIERLDPIPGFGLPMSDGQSQIENRKSKTAPPVPSWDYSRPVDTIASLATAAREPLLRALNYAGLIDIGRRAEQSFVRATPLVALILGQPSCATAGSPSRAPGGQSEPRTAGQADRGTREDTVGQADRGTPGRILLVNPDAEVILFPEGNYVELLHRLSSFCDREKSEVTLHLRISQESVRRAVLRGVAPETMLATLRDHCRAPLSQNLDYSVRNWAASVHPAEVQTLHVLELRSSELLDAVMQLPEIAPLLLRRISPTAVALRVDQLPTEAEDALKQLGVHLM